MHSLAKIKDAKLDANLSAESQPGHPSPTAVAAATIPDAIKKFTVPDLPPRICDTPPTTAPAADQNPVPIKLKTDQTEAESAAAWEAYMNTPINKMVRANTAALNEYIRLHPGAYKDGDVVIWFENREFKRYLSGNNFVTYDDIHLEAPDGACIRRISSSPLHL